MRIDIAFTYNSILEEKLKNRTVVIIDVLRASSSICTALQNGAKEIIPMAQVAQAMELANRLSRSQVLLCGEREGKLISGYDLGNSPLEYTRENVEGKTLIFTSTNGSMAMTKAASAKAAVITGFVNMSVSAEFILEQKLDVYIICSGTNQQFTLEDAVCAGMLTARILEAPVPVELSDSARAAVVLYRHWDGRLEELLNSCLHSVYLQSLGYEEDIRICGTVDGAGVLPMLKDEKIMLNVENTRI